MKKQTITNKEIEADIINALKMPAHMSEKSYRRSAIPSIIVCGAVILAYIAYPPSSLWLLIAFLAYAIGSAVFYYVRRNIRIKNVSINDYDIFTDILSHKSEEHFKVQKSKRRTETINNYSLHFENGKTWRISKDNHFWSKECPMSDAFIHENAHRGDTFILVVKRDTGEIAMAYSTELFEYKERP